MAKTDNLNTDYCKIENIVFIPIFFIFCQMKSMFILSHDLLFIHCLPVWGTSKGIRYVNNEKQNQFHYE